MPPLHPEEIPCPECGADVGVTCANRLGGGFHLVRKVKAAMLRKEQDGRKLPDPPKGAPCS